MERKEYLNRQDAPLVNPPITNGEYEKSRQPEPEKDGLPTDADLMDSAYFLLGGRCS